MSLTPSGAKDIDPSRCLARIWNNGQGGQCTRNPCSKSSFCQHHKQRQAHGRVDGEIPEIKLKEFARRRGRPIKSKKIPGRKRNSSMCLRSHKSRKRRLALSSTSADSLGEESLSPGTCEQCTATRRIMADVQQRLQTSDSALAEAEAENRSLVLELANLTRRVHIMKNALRMAGDSTPPKTGMKNALRMAGDSTPPKTIERLSPRRKDDAKRVMEVRGSEMLGYLVGEGVQRCAEIPETVYPRWILPFTVLSRNLEPRLFKYLWTVPDFNLSHEEFAAKRLPNTRQTGFEKHQNSIELVQHCLPTGPNKGLTLFGMDASQPAPLQLISFRHAFVHVNSSRLQLLQERLQQALRLTCSEREQQIFGHDKGENLVLQRASFSFATLQIRWDTQEDISMQRHVDGGPSLLHMAITLAGRRTLRTETVNASDGRTVDVRKFDLGPGSVYITSPACCYHSVEYQCQGQLDSEQNTAKNENVTERPETLIVHLRSNILRLRSNPQYFKGSNRMLAETLAPIVARSLAEDPFELPSYEDVLSAEAELKTLSPAVKDNSTEKHKVG